MSIFWISSFSLFLLITYLVAFILSKTRRCLTQVVLNCRRAEVPVQDCDVYAVTTEDCRVVDHCEYF
uniref:Uncharacterized protein n=1 Tax=Caenorhabditis japonica TaxID=281687 RepID=A0A8R1EFQ7_CAEJA